MRFFRRAMLAALFVPALWSCRRASDLLPTVTANDNRQPAGRCADGVCTVRLEVGMARWYPEADDGPHVAVRALGEEGHAPSIPGPLIRVPTGSTLDVTVTNRFTDSAITVHGLVTRPAAESAGVLVLAPGETGTAHFAAGVPGTYAYWAQVGSYADTSEIEWEQLAGALIVDSAGAAPDDRVFVINIWSEPVPGGGPDEWIEVLAINGKSYPFTEDLVLPVGDTVQWRVVNASRRNHPMHLHGFYFLMEAHGTALADTVFAPAMRRLAVTETVRARETMALTWAPTREGNWLFHCHLIFHASPELRLPQPGAEHGDHDAGSHMAGLVLGIRVPADGSTPSRVQRRERVYVQRRPAADGRMAAMGYVLERGAPPAADSVEVPGSPLILTRGELTAVTVINRLDEPTGVHWHGLELESYSDGVVGWSGVGDVRAPVILPGDSFTARLTLPRAGTFIYHTHLNDVRQMVAGLYGPLIVLEPGAAFDPTRDHVFTFGWIGDPDDQTLALNGDTAPPPRVLAAGVTHRLRFINIAPAISPPFSLWRDSTRMTWRLHAKDGADLPPAQALAGPAFARVWMGETRDVMWRPPAPGTYELRLGDPARPVIVQRFVVRE